MTPAYPQWPGFSLPAQGRRYVEAASLSNSEVPDHHSQLEEIIGHVRRCEKWARLDDRIDLSWRLDGNS